MVETDTCAINREPSSSAQFSKGDEANSKKNNPPPNDTTITTKNDNDNSSTGIPREAYFSVFVVWSALFCDYILLTMAVPIFPQLGVSESQTGLLFSMKAMLQVTSSPFVARYIDSFELEPVVFGLIVEALSCLVFALSENYGWWCCARAISGISSSAIISSGFLHIQRQFEGENDRLGHAMSIVATGIIGGVTMGPPLGGILYGVNHQLPFEFLIILISCVALITLKLQVRAWREASLRRAAPIIINQSSFSFFCDQFSPSMFSSDGAQRKKYGGLSCIESVNSNNDDGKGVRKREIEDSKVVIARAKKLLKDKHIVVTLVALFCANAAIACLESTFG